MSHSRVGEERGALKGALGWCFRRRFDLIEGALFFTEAETFIPLRLPIASASEYDGLGSIVGPNVAMLPCAFCGKRAILFEERVIQPLALDVLWDREVEVDNSFFAVKVQAGLPVFYGPFLPRGRNRLVVHLVHIFDELLDVDVLESFRAEYLATRVAHTRTHLLHLSFLHRQDASFVDKLIELLVHRLILLDLETRDDLRSKLLVVQVNADQNRTPAHLEPPRMWKLRWTREALIQMRANIHQKRQNVKYDWHCEISSTKAFFGILLLYMAKAAEKVPVSEPTPAERESGVFPKGATEKEAGDHVVDLDQIEKEALAEVQRTAAEAEAYAAAHGATDIVKVVQDDTAQAVGDIADAKDDARLATDPEAKEAHEKMTTKLAEFFKAGQESYAQRIHALEEDHRRTGATHAAEIEAKRQAGVIASRLLASPIALGSLAALMLRPDKTRYDAQDIIDSEITTSDLDPFAIRHWAETLIEDKDTDDDEVPSPPKEKTTKTSPPPADAIPLGSKTEGAVSRPASTSRPDPKEGFLKRLWGNVKGGTGTTWVAGVGTVGVGLGMSGGILKGISKAFMWFDSALGKLFSGKGILGAPERLLDWMGDLLDGKKDNKKHEE